MKNLKQKEWVTGSKHHIDFSDVASVVLKYVDKGSKIFIGCDSFVSNRKICFATTLCLYGGDEPGRYFFFKEKVPKRYYNQLATRITEEARRSLELAEFLKNEYKLKSNTMELHLDISPTNANNGTSKFSEMLKGLVIGSGFSCKIKPDAWASQSIADRHSK
jgi:predicted RNase H-related nuclease YkuK (DUF458 family)|tara:strand:- start:2228 stop:2713 length:486 start_codon:yes stop_codon:yes gene_type:complete